MKRRIIIILALFAIVTAAVLVFTISAARNDKQMPEETMPVATETQAPETETETEAETKEVVTKAPETEAETTAPETESETQPETTVAETQPPETKPAETTAPETKAETQPETQPVETVPTAPSPATCNHQWPDWLITKLSTTTTAGMKERVCPLCGAKETEVIPVIESGDSGSVDNWGEDHEHFNNDGSITQEQFDGFVAYATSQGYELIDSTGWHMDYELNKIGGNGFPCFVITMPDNLGTVLIIAWTIPDDVSVDSRNCHNISELREFFDLYRG